MGVEVHKEPEAPRGWPLESCCMCRTPTNYWYGRGPLNVALCQECASTASPASVPTKDQWFASSRKPKE